MPDRVFASSLARMRGEFEEVVREFRPDLHRYCAKIVGSAIDAEDVVQETLAKAFYSLPTMTVENLRGWLMRIAHNKAIDFLRREGRIRTETAGELPVSDEPDVPLEKQEVLTFAVSLFLKLTPKQRGCVVLKDAMDYSLSDIAETLDSSIAEVKAALHRGRTRLRQLGTEAPAGRPVIANEDDRELIELYVDRFNARDFDALRTMLSEEVRLDLVGRAQRRGAEVEEYFSRYAEVHHWRFAVGTVEDRLAMLAYDLRDASSRPSFFVLLSWKSGRVWSIRDYLFAPYVVRDAVVQEGGM